ncbi:hypothetical protein ACIGFL_14405 [Pseudomonas sp. NPDC077649]|uniref:hypothetical protein n=1 Tax=Pseudomonas sp. NPDC077649 TaxID=3364423 RepID=UPI0037CBF927
MSNQPQVVTEEIELTPHPMDAWRAALDALIACAPGDETAIAWHLLDASSQLPANRGAIEQLLHEATRANGKCLLTEAQAKQRLEQRFAGCALDALGFTRLAPWIGIDLSAAGSREQQPTGQSGTASSGEHEAQTPPHSNAPTTTIALSIQAQASPGLLVQQLCEARREPERESAPRSAAGESLLRPLGGSSCR